MHNTTIWCKTIKTRGVPNIRFIFASVPNNGRNSLFVFGRIASSQWIRIVGLQQNSPPCWKHQTTCVPQGQCCLLQLHATGTLFDHFNFFTLFRWYIIHNIINTNNTTMFRVIQLFVFVFSRIVHRLFAFGRIVWNHYSVHP